MADRPPSDDAWELDAGIVRPYLFTRGRTRPSRSSTLPVEAMLTATALARLTAGTLPGEQRRIVEQCATPQSVAEVAVAMRTPLGVVRVLVSDLYTAGLLDVHDTHEATADPADDIALLQRLITKVAALA
jgi:Protein of unknown function (DUF742)